MKNMNSSKKWQVVYFIGIGGIGMSALARYFKAAGACVKGYDLTRSPLTDELESEGMAVHYTDLGYDALTGCDKANTLVIYTPAVPESMGELSAFKKEGFTVVKRAAALAYAVEGLRLLAVAGTHGKTTTSTMLAHIMHHTEASCQAFLGGISVNSNSNLYLSDKSDFVVAEADEYDRSFLTLNPYAAIITATSPDHLDIYGTAAAYKEAFHQFASRIEKGGILVYHKDALQADELPQQISCFSYAMEQTADVFADNVKLTSCGASFDWHFPAKGWVLKDLNLPQPIRVNVLNATAAIAVAMLCGATEQEVRSSIASFQGVKRRFEYLVNSAERVYIDDYAHHPEELEAAIQSIRALYPNDAILGIFQPHLYSRTQDFYEAFARSLSVLDEVILLPIYPAREEPIPGVTSQLILDAVTLPNKQLMERDAVVPYLAQRLPNVPRIVVTLGAGNIDRIVIPLCKVLQS